MADEPQDPPIGTAQNAADAVRKAEREASIDYANDPVARPALDDDREEALDPYAFGPKGPRAFKLVETDDSGNVLKEIPVYIGAKEYGTGRHIYASELPGAMGDKIRSFMVEKGMPLPPIYVPRPKRG